MSYLVPLGTPKCCSRCPFQKIVFFHPHWSEEKPNRKAYLCQADRQRRTIEMEIYDEVTKAEWCPLIEVEDDKRSNDTTPVFYQRHVYDEPDAAVKVRQTLANPSPFREFQVGKGE